MTELRKLTQFTEQKGLEMNFLLATLLELELTGTVENIGGQIYRLRVELEIPSN